MSTKGPCHGVAFWISRLPGQSGIHADLPDFELVVTDEKVPRGSSRFSELLNDDPIDSPAHVDPASPALIGWTSGTTANPKGVIHSHETVCAEIQQLGDTSHPSSRPMLMANPISHAIGMLGALLIPIDRGRPVHLLDLWDPATVLDLMISEDLNSGGGAPYSLTSLLDHPDFTQAHLGRMEHQGLGGARCRRPSCSEPPICESSSTRCMDRRSTRRSLAARTPTNSTSDCRVTDDHYPGARSASSILTVATCQLGAAGEVISKGPDCFLGYTDPSLSAKVFDADGWYHTGDVAVMDADGYISITDRISDVIIRGGENIQRRRGRGGSDDTPRDRRGGRRSRLPDQRMGEHAAAFVRMLDGSSVPELPELRTHLDRAGVARQKWPEELVSVGRSSRTSSGKIQKFVLRDRLRQA